MNIEHIELPALSDEQISDIWSAKDQPLGSSTLTPFGMERIRAIIAAAIAAHEQARVVGEPVAWIATKDQMPPEGLRVFWMDEASNRVGYDTYAGEGYSWAASHWMRIPLIGVAPKNTDVDLVTELRRLLPVLEYYDTMRGLCNQLSEANKVRQVIYAQESTNE